MIEFTELSEGLSQLEASLDDLLSANDSSQQETQQHINHARTQLQVLYSQIQELSTELEVKDKENKLLLCKLEEALKIRNQLASKSHSHEVQLIPKKQSETEILIKVNKDLEEEVKVLRLELSKEEKHIKELYKNHRLAEDVIIQENNILKDENDSLKVDIKTMSQGYNKVKKDFLNNVEAMKALKLKLLDQKQLFQETEDLKTDNLKLSQELKEVKEKCKNIDEEFKSCTNTLNLMTEKLTNQKGSFEINRQLIEGKHALIDNLEINKISEKKYQEKLEAFEKALQVAHESIKSKDDAINCLKGELELKQKTFCETSASLKNNLETVQKELKEEKLKVRDVSSQMFECSSNYEGELRALEDFKDYLIFSNIHYNIDVEYLRSIVCNQENNISDLHTQLAECRKADIPALITKDAEVSAEVITNDVGILAVDDVVDEKIIDINIENILDKVLEHVEAYKERNQNPCDGKDVVETKKKEDPYLSKVLTMIDQKISGLLTEVKDFYETSICDLHKKYKNEAERQLSLSETSLANLKFCYEKNLKYMRREHDEKVIRLLASHKEELKNMSLYQQRVHSLKEKIDKGKRKK